MRLRVKVKRPIYGINEPPEGLVKQTYIVTSEPSS